MDWVDDLEDVLNGLGALTGLYCIVLMYTGQVKGLEGIAVAYTGFYAVFIALKEHFEHSSLH